MRFGNVPEKCCILHGYGRVIGVQTNHPVKKRGETMAKLNESEIKILRQYNKLDIQQDLMIHNMQSIIDKHVAMERERCIQIVRSMPEDMKLYYSIEKIQKAIIGEEV